MIDIDVLVAEDEPAIRKILARVLTNVDAEPTIAHNGDQAFQEYLLRPSGYDIVLTDVIMADGDGISLVKGILARNPLQENIYVMSGLPGQYEIQDIEALVGQGHFIAKPFNSERIYQIIDSVGTAKLHALVPESRGVRYLEQEWTLAQVGTLGNDGLYHVDLGPHMLHYRENKAIQNWILTDLLDPKLVMVPANNPV